MKIIRHTSLLLTAVLASTVAAGKNVRGLGPKEEERIPFGQLDSDSEVDEAGERVIGGEWVDPGEFPFFGHFLGSTRCGGVLVNQDIFVTAAHCLEDGFPPNVKIGATTTTTENEGEEVAVCAGMIHPDNNMKDMKNDIAILKLCDPVDIVAYAEWNDDPTQPSATGFDLYVIGFGRTNATVDTGMSPILRKVKLDYLNDETCETRYNKYDGEMNICADAPSRGICYGDSGGPLMGDDNKVYGFASFIVDSCASDYPDFFTRISTYADWLDEMI